VDVAVEAGARLRDDEAAEGGEIVGPGIAGGDAGRAALMLDEFVGARPLARLQEEFVGN